MAKLQMLSFEDDDIIAQRIKEESNYCDMAQPSPVHTQTF